MSSEKVVSRYAPNAVSGKKKHIYSRLLDYFLTLVLSYIVFIIALPTTAGTKTVTSLVDNLSIARKEICLFVDETRLQRYDSANNVLFDVNDGAAKYVESLAKTSAYVHNIDFPVKQNDGTFIYQPVNVENTFVNDASNYPLDNVSYYYHIFKPTVTELNDYDGKRYDELTDSEIQEYIFTARMAINKSLYVTSDDHDYVARGSSVSIYSVLNVESTNKLIKYYADDRNDLTIYNSVFNSYGRAIVFGINEVESKSIQYRALSDNLNFYYQGICRFDIVTYFISYFIAYILLNLIICLVSKEWVTIGQKVLGLGVSDDDEMEPPVWKMLLYHLLNLFLFASGSLLVFYLLGMIGVTSLYVIPYISLLAILLFILPFNLIDLFMPIFSKKRNSLVTLILKLKLKDKKEFDIPVGADISDKKDGNEAKN